MAQQKILSHHCLHSTAKDDIQIKVNDEILKKGPSIHGELNEENGVAKRKYYPIFTAHDFSEPHSFIDGTIKLTESNSDHFETENTNPLICFEHVNSIDLFLRFVHR